MENILGFLVFVVIVAISIVNKIATERKAAQEQKEEQERPKSVDELPEATRRMLFGDGEIIVAKPRGARPEQSPAPPRPAPVQQPVPARQVMVEPPRPVQRPVPARRVPVEAQPQHRPQQQRTTPPLRQQPRQQRPTPTQQRQRRPAPAQKIQPSRSARPATTPVVVKRAAPPPSRPQGVAQLMRSKNELARAVLLREILGPPKALEDL